MAQAAYMRVLLWMLSSASAGVGLRGIFTNFGCVTSEGLRRAIAFQQHLGSPTGSFVVALRCHVFWLSRKEEGDGAITVWYRLYGTILTVWAYSGEMSCDIPIFVCKELHNKRDKGMLND